MLLLLDRAFDAGAFFAEVTATGAVLLARAKSTRKPAGAGPPARRLLPVVPGDGLAVRIIEADLAMTGADGSRVADRYRLITTLLDHRRYPAAELVAALPRAVGDRVRLPGAAAHPAGRPGAALG